MDLLCSPHHREEPDPALSLRHKRRATTEGTRAQPSTRLPPLSHSTSAAAGVSSLPSFTPAGVGGSQRGRSRSVDSLARSRHRRRSSASPASDDSQVRHRRTSGSPRRQTRVTSTGEELIQLLTAPASASGGYDDALVKLIDYTRKAVQKSHTWESLAANCSSPAAKAILADCTHGTLHFRKADLVANSQRKLANIIGRHLARTIENQSEVLQCLAAVS